MSADKYSYVLAGQNYTVRSITKMLVDALFECLLRLYRCTGPMVKANSLLLPSSLIHDSRRPAPMAWASPCLRPPHSLAVRYSPTPPWRRLCRRRWRRLLPTTRPLSPSAAEPWYLNASSPPGQPCLNMSWHVSRHTHMPKCTSIHISQHLSKPGDV